MELKGKSIEDLKLICENIRKRLIEVVSKTGGHLASNLGVVELTVTLHSIFDLENTSILWDVGHQSYVHKILSGRDDKFETIRQYKGLSPFTNPKESKHDHFVAGHAGNSLSAANGIAEADKDKKVIALIGDASLGNGQALEALNNIGSRVENLIVILNDNEMSIGKNVGALFKHISRIMSKKAYSNLKEEVEGILKKIKFGKSLAELIKRLEHSLRYFVYPGSIFEELGFNYVGPIDGHNLAELKTTFNDISAMKGPIFVHVKTTKGKGYDLAENNKEKFHGISPFNVETGETGKKKAGYSKVFGDKLTELAEKDSDIIAISAAMINGTGLREFFDKYPERSYDVGIAEEHAVTFAGGLAIKGKKPVVAVYSTFMQRAYDQLIHDIALQNLPVTFVLDRAGIVGEDGETHQGIFDISYLSTIPNFVITAPATKAELEQILEFSLSSENKNPLGIRIPRSAYYEIENDYKIEFGKWNEIKKGEDILILAAGSMLKEVMELEENLAKRGVNPTIVSTIFIKPFDEKYILENIDKYSRILVMEENVKSGGFGSSVLEFLNGNGICKKIEMISIDNKFIEHGKRDELLEINGLRGESLLQRIVEGGN